MIGEKSKLQKVPQNYKLSNNNKKRKKKKRSLCNCSSESLLSFIHISEKKKKNDVRLNEKVNDK